MANNICAPPPARCKMQPGPLKVPGISTRRIPLCRPPNCEGLKPGVGEWWVNSQGTLDRSDWIRGWAWTQLNTRGLTECDDNPLNQRSGGWWADGFRSDRFISGSLLWTLKWARVTNETLLKAQEYAQTALNYLIGWGICSSIKVKATYVSKAVLQLDVNLIGPGNSALSFSITGTAQPDQTYLWQIVPPGAY